MSANSEKPFAQFADGSAFREWLDANHATHTGIRMKIAKKGAPTRTLSYDEAVDAALAYGWIDGQKGSFDAEFYVQVFTQRRPRSVWSRRNVEKVATLIEAGMMMPAGLAQVEAAQADGRWAKAYEGGAATAPDQADFIAALEMNPAAKEFYATINAANRYAIYWRINDAKLDATRARRIASFVEMLGRGETLH
jgi:uncharacterized protein YdeI (YjbR/CyaY-like superfamily)